MAAAENLFTLPSREARFWDNIAAKYARRPVADEKAYQRKLAATRERLAPDMRLLEVGCGTGSTAIAHAPCVARIDATDISGEMIAIAEVKAAAASVGNVVFRRAALDELEAPAEGYDGVLALSLLHLVEDRDAALDRIRRMLKPGGLFVSNTVCLGDGMGYFRYIAPLGRRLGLLPTLRVFTAAELEASLARAGFETELKWQPGARPTVFIIARSHG